MEVQADTFPILPGSAQDKFFNERGRSADVKPFDTGFLEVDGGRHKLYYEQYGNPNGDPVMLMHGGPGFGSMFWNHRYFDLNKYRVIMMDQRGAGRSVFTRSQPNDYSNLLVNNNTRAQIADYHALSKKLGLKRFHLQGGSWGANLVLIYGILHPEQVKTITTRGMAVGRLGSIELLYEADAQWHSRLRRVRNYSDEDWEKYDAQWQKFIGLLKQHEALIPKDVFYQSDGKTPDTVAAYQWLLDPQHHTVPWDVKKEAAVQWFSWEIAAGSFTKVENPEKRFEGREDYAYRASAIESSFFTEMRKTRTGNPHTDAYFTNGKRDYSYIMDNVGKLAHIPIFLVHGTHDNVILIEEAQEMYAGLKQARLRKGIPTKH